MHMEEDGSDLDQQDDDLLNMENNNMPGGIDQEDLTQEQKDETIIKNLYTYNP